MDALLIQEQELLVRRAAESQLRMERASLMTALMLRFRV